MAAVGSAVGLSIVSKITELLVQPTIDQFRYAFCFKSFVEELGELKGKIDLAIQRVQNDVADAKRNDEEIQKDVEQLLTNADLVMKDVMVLENKITNEKKCFSWCPNLFRRYKLGKQLGGKIATLKKLENEADSIKFQNVGCKKPVQSIEFRPSKGFTPSKSSEKALRQVMEALENDEVNMIGLYGMAGVGKTTLVKEIGRNAEEFLRFDQVLMVVVSQTPDVMKIQDRIAEILGLKFDGETTKEGRAERLLHRLKGEKKVLVILDDVWDYLQPKELEYMGIPFEDNQRNKDWKFLLTTRRQEVCTSMDCQMKMILEVLLENEAWDLFRIKANLCNEDSALYDVAIKVAKQCKCLPLAIVAVGTALRGKKTMKEWEVAFRQLKTLLRYVGQGDREKNVYACLKMSYDYLDRETRLCFLLCSLFPEDHEILIENLTRYAIGWGVYHDARSMEEARDQMFVAIKVLKDSCMLLEADRAEHVKMHDLVREVAIWIASEGEQVFMVKAGIGLKEWPMDIKSFEGFTAISLIGNNIAELPDGLVCPSLKILMLGGERDHRIVVPDKFFEGMKALEVLSLKGASLSLRSLESLPNLQSLELTFCECKDLNSLGKLQKLKIFNLSWLHINELPEEIGELKSLTLLELTRCWGLTKVPVNLIGRLVNLEELYFGNYSFKEWDAAAAGTSTERMNASLIELNSLSHLARLSLDLPKVEQIPREFVFPELHRYEIRLGKHLYNSSEYPTSRKLILCPKRSASLNTETCRQLFQNVCDLYLGKITGIRSIIPEVYEGGFEELTDLHLERCGQMEHLVDTRQLVPTAAFSNLKYLYMAYMPDFTEMCNGQPPKGFLQELQEVRMDTCHAIHTLFPANLCQTFQNLLTVNLYMCCSLDVVFELDGGNEANEVLLLSTLTKLCLRYLSNLKHIWKGPTQHISLQSLVYLELKYCDLTVIFSQTLAQSLLQLETLDIRDCNKLKHIVGEKADEEQEIIAHSLCFPKLRTLRIESCHQLEYVLPVSVAPSLLQLEEITIKGSSQLKRVFGNGEGDEDEDGIFVFSRLKRLDLQRLPNLSEFGPKNMAVKFPSLQHLEIVGDTQLEYVLLVSVAPSLLQLEEITIKDSSQLKRVFGNGEGDEDEDGNFVFPRMRKLDLQHLPNLIEFGPKNVAVEFPSLQHLEIVGENQLGNSLAQLQGLSNVQEIRIGDWEGKQLELRSIWNGSTLKNLTNLVLFSCLGLRHVFPSSIVPNLVQLKSLTVSSCKDLEEVIAKDTDENGDILLESHPQSFCFPNLLEIKVEWCDKLKVLFPVTICEGFPLLRNLAVIGTAQLTQVFGESDKAACIDIENKVVVPSLLELSLEELPSLVCFGPKQYHFIFPSLERLSVKKCLKMTTTTFTTATNYSVGAERESLINLRTLSVGDCGVLEVLQVGSCLTGRQGENELSLLSLETLDLSHLSELRFIWKGLALKNLTTLKVDDCNSLRYVLSPSMIQSLVQLKSLKISRCEELEQILAKNDDGNGQMSLESHPQSLGFPNLCEIDVRKCIKLKSLFPVTIATGLPQLQYIKLRSTPQLTEVFAQDDVAACINVEKLIIVPNLQKLFLRHLPSLTHFSPGVYAFLFPSLKQMKVGNCPQMNMKFSITPNGSMTMSARLEAPQVAEDSSSTCSEPTYRVWDRHGGWHDPWWIAMGESRWKSQRDYDMFEEKAYKHYDEEKYALIHCNPKPAGN